MGEWRRLFYYLLLNVLVSAVTTLAVLIVWDKMQLSGSDFTSALPIGQKGTLVQATALSPTETAGSAMKTGTPEIVRTDSPQNQPTLAAAAATKAPQSNVSSEASLVIENVIGAGDLGTEKIFVKRMSGEGPLSLASWRIKGEKGQEYTFPQITLYNPGAVYVHTMTGADTPRDLYWGKSEPAWSSGAEVTLLDNEGRVQATYKIP